MGEREHVQPEHLRVEIRHTGDRAIVALRGELDLASAPLLESEIEGGVPDGGALVLDLDDLKFIDSTGLRLILTTHERAIANGQEFAVTKGSEQVQRLLTITGVGEHLRIIESPDELLV